MGTPRTPGVASSRPSPDTMPCRGSARRGRLIPCCTCTPAPLTEASNGLPDSASAALAAGGYVWSAPTPHNRLTPPPAMQGAQATPPLPEHLLAALHSGLFTRTLSVC